MNIQIFGTNKCFDTKKAQRWFKERGIKFQFIDLTQKNLSKGEYNSVKAAVGSMEALIDENSKAYEKHFIRYLASKDAVEEKLLEHGELYKTPIVRNGRQATAPISGRRGSDQYASSLSRVAKQRAFSITILKYCALTSLKRQMRQ